MIPLIDSFLCFSCFISFLHLGGESFVLFLNLVEFIHILEEIGASLQSDEQLGFFGVSSLSLDCDRLSSDLLESSIIVSNKVLRGNDAGRRSISKGV